MQAPTAIAASLAHKALMAQHAAQVVQTRVGFQVRGDDVEPELVATRLALSPSASHRRGDVADSGNGERTVRTDGWCYFSSQSEVARDAPFEHHIAWVLEHLAPHASLLSAWVARGWRVQLDIITVTSATNGGPTVSPELLRGLASLGVPACFRTVCTNVR